MAPSGCVIQPEGTGCKEQPDRPPIHDPVVLEQLAVTLRGDAARRLVAIAGPDYGSHSSLVSRKLSAAQSRNINTTGVFTVDLLSHYGW
jgi:hypothetical protein